MAKRATPQTKDVKKDVLPKQTASGVRSHTDMAAGTELARNALSRERYLFQVKVTMSIAIALIVSVLCNVYLGIRPVEYRYFTTDPSGGIRPIQALDRPIQSSEFVLNWTTAAVTKAYSMNFANYAQQLKDVEPSFNEAGWKGFQDALQTSGYLENMISNQYATSSVPKSAPIIAAQGILNGVFAWRVQIPIIVTYKSASVSQTQELNVEAVIVRRPETENPSGLGIAQIISK